MIICLAGMHRSGTSLMSSYLEYCGIPMGDKLLGAGKGNEHGHFEDYDFLNFHKKVLEANSSNFFVPRSNLILGDEFLDEAKSLIEGRNNKNDIWGWKEPRTTLFLDFWNQIDPDIKYIFMYRDAYKVTESLYRRMKIKYKFFMPWLAPKSWIHYNKKVIDFVTKYPEKSIVISIDGLNKAQNTVIELVGPWIGCELDKPYSDIYKPASMTSGTGKKMSLLIRLYMALTRLIYGRKITSIYNHLQEIALVKDTGNVNKKVIE